MSAQFLKIAIPAILILVAAGIVVYFVFRYIRGSIKITLPKYGFNAGEKIKGSFELTTRKPIEGRRLYAALIGEEITKVRRGNTTRTQRREVFRNEETIEEARAYSTGQTQQYTFELSTPLTAEPDFLNTPLGQALKMGLELLSGHRRSVRWKVEVRLDAKGIDLASSKKVTINILNVV